MPGRGCLFSRSRPRRTSVRFWPSKRHHVGDGTERYQVEQVFFDLGNVVRSEAAASAVVSGGTQHCLRQPIGDTHAGQAIKLGRAVGTPRVDHRQRRRQLRPDRVMVGDDDIHAQALGVRHFLDAADAAVDRNQELCLGRNA